MASVLEVVNGVGSVAGIVGIGYQIYTTQRDRAERRRGPTRGMPPGAPTPAAPTPTPTPTPAAPASTGARPVPGGSHPPTPVPVPAGSGGARPASGEPESDLAFWFGLVAPILMGAYLWLAALGGFSYISDLSLAGGTPEAAQSQVRYTVVLMVVNALWAAALAFRHSRQRPLPARVWVYGLAAPASAAAGIGLLTTYSSIIF